MNRAGPFFARWRVKRLEREMSDLLRELDAVYAQLEQAYKEAEDVSGFSYLQRARAVPLSAWMESIPRNEPDTFDAEQGSNVVKLRPQ